MDRIDCGVGGRARHVFRAVVVAASLTLCACQPRAVPDVVLVSLDTVRADVFDQVAATEPTLRLLREGAVTFRAAVSPTPLTLPAHATLLSGLDPNRHGARNNGQHPVFDVAPLAERLQAQGYATGAVVSAFPLDRQFGLARGFDHYDQPQAPAGARSEFATLERSAEASVTAALNWFDARTGPRFLWLHLFDAHAPYLAPGSDPASDPRRRYAEEIAYAGAALAPLLQRLENSGRPFILVLVADHGEGLGDHEELDHGLLLYDSTLLVPMLWYSPGRWTPRRIEQTARLADVVPTLLAALELAPQALSDGIDLGPLLQGDALTVPAAYAETFYPQYAYRRAPLRSLRASEWKLITTDSESELFDLRNDAGELEDRAAAEPARVDAMHFDLAQRPEPSTPAANVAPQVLRQLQSLGYLAAGVDAQEPGGHPREVVSAHRRLVELQNLIGVGRIDAAFDAARALRAEQPDNAFVAYVLGIMLIDRGDARGAVDTLTQAVELDPQNAQARFKLAETLMRVERHADALPHWQVLEALEPQRVAVWINQAGALARLGNWEEAHLAIRQALSLAPDDATALDNAATIAHQLGRWSETADYLDRLRAGSSPPAPGRHGLALLRAGRDARAIGLLEGVDRASPEWPLAQFGLALAWSRTGRETQAREALHRLQRSHPALVAAGLREFPEVSALTDSSQ